MPDYRAMARRAAMKYGVDPNIFERQIGQESGYAQDVITGRRASSAGAQGIAQIMPATARGWGVNPLNPAQALDAAAKNMGRYVRQYGSYENALRAYNAGPGAIERSKGFSETNHYVQTILRGRDPGRLGTPRRSTGGGGGDDDDDDGGGTRTRTTNTTTTVTPGVDNRAARAQLIQSFLSDKKADPVDFALQARALKDVAPTSTSSTQTGTSGGRTTTSGGGGGGGAGGLADTASERADIINRQALPYKWGGGHGGQTKINDAIPLDCSGAVSKVLGIDPRVSGNFQSWGRPGEGSNPNKGVVVYSNPKHVLMSINGKFFGTSGSNPGGGAGWIPRSQISPEYLRGFTARHSKR